MNEPQFTLDKFRIYWREASTGVIYSDSEKAWLIQKYQQHMAGKAKLEGVPVKGAAAKFFDAKHHL